MVPCPGATVVDEKNPLRCREPSTAAARNE